MTAASPPSSPEAVERVQAELMEMVDACIYYAARNIQETGTHAPFGRAALESSLRSVLAGSALADARQMQVHSAQASCEGRSLGSSVPEGWKLVPVKLHEAVRDVLIDRFERSGRGGESLLFTDIWRDLLAASPIPAGAEVGKEEAPTVEEILKCADAYGDARIMASKCRVDRSQVDEARNELRAMVARALGVQETSGGKKE